MAEEIVEELSEDEVEGTAGDDLSAAWDVVEAEEASIEEAPAEEAALEVAEEAPTEEAPTEPTEEAPTEEAPTEEAPAEEEDVAPVGLPPAAREAWGDTPTAMKEAIRQREVQFAAGIQKYSEGAKRASAMDRSLAPFQQYFAMNGNQPSQTINSLLQTASILQMGNPVQRAQTVANLVSQFGVDIETLDKILVGETPSEGAQVQSQVEAAVQKAVAPYQQAMHSYQEGQQQQGQQVRSEAGAEVQAFANDPSHEFYMDVRSDMADLLEMSARRGINLSMEDAYAKAVALSPDIQKILTTRAARASIANKQRAATPVTGNPGGPGDTSVPDTIRGNIEAAWDNQGRA